MDIIKEKVLALKKQRDDLVEKNKNIINSLESNELAENKIDKIRELLGIKIEPIPEPELKPVLEIRRNYIPKNEYDLYHSMRI